MPQTDSASKNRQVYLRYRKANKEKNHLAVQLTCLPAVYWPKKWRNSQFSVFVGQKMCNAHSDTNLKTFDSSGSNFRFSACDTKLSLHHFVRTAVYHVAHAQFFAVASFSRQHFAASSPYGHHLRPLHDPAYRR